MSTYSAAAETHGFFISKAKAGALHGERAVNLLDGVNANLAPRCDARHRGGFTLGRGGGIRIGDGRQRSNRRVGAAQLVTAAEDPRLAVEPADHTHNGVK